MNISTLLAVTSRVLSQVRRDRRTLALITVMPTVLMALLAWVFSGTEMFNHVAPALFAFFPFTIMFLVTSITTLGERNSGTLERTLTMPVHRADIIGGYALAFGVLSVLQTIISASVSVGLLGLDIDGSVLVFFGVSLLDALVGCAMGLLASAFARTEFQAVQFMPALILPQALVCGLLVPRSNLPHVLEIFANFMPLSYAVDAMQALTSHPAGSPVAATDPNLGVAVAALCGFFVVFIFLAAISMRRQTD